MVVSLLRAGAAISLCWAALPAAPVLAHSGTHGDVSVSNYRTRVTSVTPAVDGLSVKVLDAGGRLELTWRGDGVLVVEGYQGEPYLRIDDDGVYTNVRSKAGYLNSTRYATATVPAIADNDAPPDWKRTGGGRTVRWHDHRSHWMSPHPPPEVEAVPDDPHVVYDHWTIAVTVDGRPVEIVGDLTWIPPPDRWAWYLTAAAVGVVALAILLTPWWRHAAWIVIALTTVAMLVTALSVASSLHQLSWWMPAGWAIELAAAVSLLVAARRRAAYPPAALLVAGVFAIYLGGVRHLALLSHSQVSADGPLWLVRAAVIVSLGLGAAATARFAAFLVPALVNPTGRNGRLLNARPAEAKAD